MQIFGPKLRDQVRRGRRPFASLAECLNENIGVLNALWIILTMIAVYFAAQAFSLSLRVAQEPELNVDKPVILCEDALSDTEYVQAVTEQIPASYTVRTCRIRVRDGAAPATGVNLYISIAEGAHLLVKRVGVYSSVFPQRKSKWGRPLSSLRWKMHTPKEQTEPRNVGVSVDRMLVGEVLDLRLDIAYDPRVYKGNCKDNFYFDITAKEVVRIGRAVQGLADLCP